SQCSGEPVWDTDDTHLARHHGIADAYRNHRRALSALPEAGQRRWVADFAAGRRLFGGVAVDTAALAAGELVTAAVLVLSGLDADSPRPAVRRHRGDRLGRPAALFAAHALAGANGDRSVRAAGRFEGGGAVARLAASLSARLRRGVLSSRPSEAATP